MATLIKASAPPDSVVYLLLRNGTFQPYNPALNSSTGGFEAYSSGNYASHYALAMTQQSHTGRYTIPVPTSPALVRDEYDLDIRLQSGGSPAESDPQIGGGVLDWDGAQEIDLSLFAVNANGNLTLVQTSSSGAAEGITLTVASNGAVSGPSVASVVQGEAYEIDVNGTMLHTATILSATLALHDPTLATVMTVMGVITNNGSTNGTFAIAFVLPGSASSPPNTGTLTASTFYTYEVSCVLAAGGPYIPISDNFAVFISAA